MLYQLSYARAPHEWWGKDSNLRRLTPADLQSAPFGHSGTPPAPSLPLHALPLPLTTDPAFGARGVCCFPEFGFELTKGLEPLTC